MKNYIPNAIDTNDISLPADLIELIEKIAENVHDVWAAGRIADGWKYGEERNDKLKLHPCLIHYDELPDSEKEYDRSTAASTLKLIQKFGYEIKRKD